MRPLPLLPLLLVVLMPWCEGATLTGCGQEGLTEAEAATFADSVSDSGGDYWEIGSDGLVEYADSSLFPGKGNPNSITQQNHVFTVPKVPLYVSAPQCLPGGAIGVYTTATLIHVYY